MKLYASRRDAAGLRFAIVVSRFNHLLCARLLDGAVGELVARGADADALHVAWVPGAFEIPQAARTLAGSGRYDAIVTLGVVIRGGTPHFDYVCSAVTDGVREVVRDTDVPVAFGVLTCDDVAQAMARAGGEHGNKGVEAALAAIEMAHLGKALRRPPESGDRPRRPRSQAPRGGARGPRGRGRRS
jgi:6,7-dimethyl-8-ribityllumazine synthase